MTPGLVLNELNLYFSPACFLVCLWLVIVVVVISCTVLRVLVLYERVVTGYRHGRVDGVETLTFGS